MTTHPHLEGLILALPRFDMRHEYEGFLVDPQPDGEFVRFADLEAALAALPGGGVDELRGALQRFVADAEEVDLGGGDAVVTTCESLDAAKAALGIPRPLAHHAKALPTPNPHEADRNG